MAIRSESMAMERFKVLWPARHVGTRTCTGAEWGAYVMPRTKYNKISGNIMYVFIGQKSRVIIAAVPSEPVDESF